MLTEKENGAFAFRLRNRFAKALKVSRDCVSVLTLLLTFVPDVERNTR